MRLTLYTDYALRTLIHTTWWSARYSLCILLRCHAAVTASLVQRNSVPSTQIRCMITANRRARATIAFFIPRRLATAGPLSP